MIDNFSAASGTIVKSHPKSRFEISPLNSLLTGHYLANPDSIVLQIMQCQEGLCILEFVDKKDYP